MKTLLIAQAAITAVLVALVALTQDHSATISVLSGAAVTGLNLVFLVVSWPFILRKKQVALGTLSIVFKFALLVGILYFVSRSGVISLGWFSIGLGTVVVSVLIAGMKEVGRARTL